MVKSVILILWSLLATFLLSAQELTSLGLQQAYDMARNNYPAIRQKDLIRRTADLSIENLQKGFLPQLNLNAQATYQSAVTEVPVRIAGLAFEPLSRDQYKVVADLNQLLYDGGVTRQQKTLENLNATVEDQKVEVELYKLKERINQVYLGILYSDEQLKQLDLLKADIETGIKRVEAQVQNGTAFKSNLNMLKAELLEIEQRGIETKASRKGLVDALALFLGQPLDENVRLEKMVITGFAMDQQIARPELKLYDHQSILIGQQDKLITAKNLPKASLFAQGGYGRPGLDVLKNEFAPYYIGGVRLNWSIGGLYTKKREKEKVELSKKMVDVQKETFLLTTNTQLVKERSEIEKLQKLITSDNEIIDLRKTVTDAAKAQLENGVITASDYLEEINAEDQARQLLIAHQLLLLQAQINYLTISGRQ